MKVRIKLMEFVQLLYLKFINHFSIFHISYPKLAKEKRKKKKKEEKNSPLALGLSSKYFYFTVEGLNSCLG